MLTLPYFRNPLQEPTMVVAAYSNPSAAWAGFPRRTADTALSAAALYGPPRLAQSGDVFPILTTQRILAVKLSRRERTALSIRK